MAEKVLSVIIPCLNEADNIPSIIAELAKYADAAKILETIIVDDSSNDNTRHVAESIVTKYPELNIQVITRPKPRRGYGAVVRFGIENARGRYCTFVAADGVDPIRLLPDYVRVLQEGAQLVQCSRYINPGDDSTIPFTYKFYQKLFRTFQWIALGRQVPDSTYAFKAFDRELVLRLGVSSNRFNISPEIVFKVLLSGGKIVTLPGSQGVRARGVSKFKFRKEGYGYFKVALRAALHRLGIRWFNQSIQ
jgi:glycosyltransferase involved in cell wall biosynthesis